MAVKKKEKLNNLVVYGIVLIVIALAIFGVYMMSKNVTGNFILGVDTTYLPNESLKGSVDFNLKRGELLPSTTVVKISVGSETYEYPLNELIDSEAVSGNFYVEGKDISGSGEGYGVEGTGKIYPDVNFIMKVSKDKGDTKTEEEPATGEEPATSETPAEEEPTETTTPETATSETPTTTEEPATTETPTETTTTTPEPATGKTNTETTTETPTTTEEPATSEESPSEPNSGSLITGSAVSDLGNIKGTVNAKEPYTYDLGEDKIVEIVSSDHDVFLNIENKVATVTTDYFETGDGFGEDFLGDYAYQLKIDLTSLNIPAEEGDLVVGLSYEDDEIATASSALSVESPESSLNVTTINESEQTNIINETGQNITEQNVTEQNITAEIAVENFSDYKLTDEELDTLKSELGVSEVKITKAEVVDDRLIIRFDLGNLWLEKSYNYQGESDDLDYQIELDRVKWVKKIAQSLSESFAQSEDVSKYIGNYELQI